MKHRLPDRCPYCDGTTMPCDCQHREANLLVGTIYLIHFERPFKHAQHYMGFSQNLPQRLNQHKKGCGSKLMRAVSAAGIRWAVVEKWTGDRHFERKLKNHRNHGGKCWICKAYKKSAHKTRRKVSQ